MRRIRRLLDLPAHEKWLLIKAWLLVFSIRLALWTLRFKLTERLLRRFNARPPQRLSRNRPPARRVARLVNIASRLVPGGSQCLTKALAAESLLVRRGYPTEVRLGVTRDEANKLIAHAWVLCEGVVLMGDEDLQRYTELTPPSARH